MASIMRPSLLRQTPASTRSLLLRQNVGVSQAVNFHASARKQILPPLPLNDPAPLPKPSPVHGSYHWTFERFVASSSAARYTACHTCSDTDLYSAEPSVLAWFLSALHPSLPAPLTLSWTPFSAVFSSFTPTLVLSKTPPAEAMTYDIASITDYFRPQRVPKTHALLKWLLRGFTLTTAVGLYEFETNDVGITEALRRIWTA
ncbi:Succinate dehydrogenase cytochrome b small subunit [Penicillium chermesinum]|nr:Succinate dehydrogenase cytochrome b small subunit [Penicillium chermesinum]